MKPPFTFLELLLESGPALLAARFFARQNRLAERVLYALQVDFNLVADLELHRIARRAKFAHRHASFHLQADVNHRDILFEADHLAFDDATLDGILFGKAFGEQRGKLFVRWV